MSKELTPLRAFDKILGGLCGEAEYVKKEIHIVENALERLKELDSLYTLTNHNGKFYVVIDKTEFDRMLKQLNALEIIKEKGTLFFVDDEGNPNTTEEERKILKEVLENE